MASRTSSRKSGPALDPALPQKKRARRRLIGAAAVCLAAVIALPILLDSEPRQVRGDIEARIPSRDTPLYEPTDAAARSGSIRQQASGERSAPPQASGDASGAVTAPQAPASAASSATDVSAQTRTQTGSAATSGASAGVSAVAPVTAPKAETQAKSPKPASAERDDPIAKLAKAQESSATRSAGFIVQIGAFASDKSASGQIERARKAGFSAYKETVRTAQGDRIRVRVGPFSDRDAADKARAKLRGAGIDSVLVTP